MKFRLGVARVVAPFVLMAFVTAGCSGEAGTPDRRVPADAADDAGVTREQPFAAFPDGDLRVLDDVRRKLMHTCMVESGYREYAAADPESTERVSPSLVLDRELVGWAGEAHARARGFGLDVPATPVTVLSADVNHDTVLDTCVQGAQTKIGPEFRKVEQRAVDLFNELNQDYVRAFDTNRFKELNSRVVTCLADAGFTVDDAKRKDSGLRPEAFGIKPGGPEGTEPEKGRPKPGTLLTIPASPARRYVPTDGEAELAAAVFRCQRKDGVIGELRALVNDAQRAAWTKHEDELAELKPALASLAKKASQLV
ncbi:hypothetical protein LO762_28540 [Actinocorallia sp. API 0066]|uniref:hypothetical protein n=1 Tax=Actinocorallia sp. API 0066 TaxID=2896846 RepID=UPI001E52E064|nr:hypothetical protein [Actinocorallia sp. API 0066]MCD0453102.1 hypothetical protein [Actinocorallia sp. API 0066]